MPPHRRLPYSSRGIRGRAYTHPVFHISILHAWISPFTGMRGRAYMHRSLHTFRR